MNAKYTFQGIYGVAGSLEFYPDGSFHYYWIGGLVWGHTYGCFELKGRKVLLNSDLQPNDLLSTISGSESCENNKVRILVSFSDTARSSNTYVVVYKDGQKVQDIDSGWDFYLNGNNTIDLEMTKPDTGIDSVAVYAFGSDKAVLRNISTHLPDTITCLLRPSPINYVSFTNKTLKAKPGRVVNRWKDEKFGRMKVVYLQRDFQ